jgi:hypothetical protein
MAFVEAKLDGDLELDLTRYEILIQEKVMFAGAAAMANVIYQEVLANVHKLGRKSGNLEKAVFRAYSDMSSSPLRKTYRITWRHKDAPHGKLLEYGYWQPYQVVLLPNGDWFTDKSRKLDAPKRIPAHPFLRPAFAKMQTAITIGKARMAEKLTEIA